MLYLSREGWLYLTETTKNDIRFANFAGAIIVANVFIFVIVPVLYVLFSLILFVCVVFGSLVALLVFPFIM